MLLFIYLLDITFPLIDIDTGKPNSRPLAVRCPYATKTDANEERRHEFGAVTVHKDGTTAFIVSFSFHRLCVLVAPVSEERSIVLVRGSTFSDGSRKSAVI